jgi:prophage regulatory protein
MNSLISIKETCRRTTWSRTTLWQKVRDGHFPKPVSFPGSIRKAFVEDEVNEYIDARIAERDGRAA